MQQVAEASRYAIPSLWAVWMIGWLAASWNVKQNQWREAPLDAIRNRAPVVLAWVLLAAPWLLPAVINRRILPPGARFQAIGLGLVMAGLLLAAWARWHLGRNWSGQVTVKVDHTFVHSGPYRRVRHPIYTGLLLAFFGTALAIGSPRGFIALLLATAGFVVKLRVEEARMRETFVEYAAYCRGTARLLPGFY
jgi:protein-S-isoprenylcysteine O-methyltransferase Ste14